MRRLVAAGAALSGCDAPGASPLATRDMNDKGGCHCGNIAFEVAGDLEQAIECNCSHCSRKGYLLWFLPRAKLNLLTSETNLATYQNRR